MTLVQIPNGVDVKKDTLCPVPPSHSRRRHGPAGVPPEAGVPVGETSGVGDGRDDGRDAAVGDALHDAGGHQGAIPGVRLRDTTQNVFL